MASLKENINQVNADFRSIKEAIEAKGVEIADGTPTEKYADKIGEIMSGEVPSIDADKIIPRTISGKSIALKDVSEIPHYATCKISGVDDPTQVKVKIVKKNLFPNDWEEGHINQNTGDLTSTLTGYIRTKDYFRLDTSQKYYISSDDVTTGISAVWYLYDQNKDYIGHFIGTVNRTIGSYGVQNVITNFKKAVFFKMSIKVSNVNAKVQIELGSRRTEFKPYEEVIYTPNEEGIVENILSKSPYMFITTDSGNANIEITYNRSYGMQRQYDYFWDMYQKGGARKDYRYAFYSAYEINSYWDEDILRPKYDIISGNQAIWMFAYITAQRIMKGYEATEPLGINTSEVTSANYMFYQAGNLLELPPIDFSNVYNKNNTNSVIEATGTFSGCKSLKSLHLKVSENTVYVSTDNASGTFNNCIALEELIIEGTIGKTGFNVKTSPLLNKTSIESIINALSDNKTGLTVLLSLEAVNKAFETAENAKDGSTSDEWNNLRASKSNWTITLG